MISFSRFDENNIVITADHDPEGPGCPVDENGLPIKKSVHYFPSSKWQLMQEVLAKYSTDVPTEGNVIVPDYSSH